jgi:transketolase|tara:strand:- start:321 stop:1160 length:840 start_codon:yes stop_codon:yes gene_type:complete
MEVDQDNAKMNDFFRERSLWLRRETLKIHNIAPETRIASALSSIEIFVVLYYGKILRFDPKNIYWEGRDRFIISKGHGATSLYPILADFGFFDKKELERVCQKDSFLGIIPDSIIPGFETNNGSLGHGLGVSCGISLALKRKKSNSKVFVLLGDGELNEGSIWESIMFAAEHKLDNIMVIIDNNKVSMLDYCKNIINLTPMEEKFKIFGWDVETIDGHNVEELYNSLIDFRGKRGDQKPKILIADTVKGKGVSMLENDPLCHVKSLSKDEATLAIKEMV